MRTYFKSGSWNAICDVCGFAYKSDELRRRWDGLMVCDRDFETRHPQDLIRIPREDPSVPWSRPQDNISNLLVCTFINSQAIAGIGVAGCAVTGRFTPLG